MELPTRQADLRRSDYRDRIKNQGDHGTPVAFAAPVKDYTPGIVAAPLGKAATMARFPYMTTMLTRRVS